VDLCVEFLGFDRLDAFVKQGHQIFVALLYNNAVTLFG